MAKKYINWKTKGMIRDTSVSAFNPEYSFENLNLRLSTNEGNTAFSWVNEKGTSLLTINIQIGKWNSTIEHTIAGTVVGTAVIDDKLVLFTHRGSVAEGQDTIYLLKTSGTELEGKILYRGDLNFLISNPIETIVSYESDSIQKVYWTDGINQPRMINVGADDTTTISSYNDNSFDFVPELQLNETVTVTRSSGSGEFPSGVIKYAFTYYDKFGRESAIFYTTPQYYISFLDRGAAPDEKVNMSFNITVNNIDTNFDYLRVYSILRTSINSTPYCKRVADVDLSNIQTSNSETTVTIIDTGNIGETIDPTELLYKGGEDFTVQTLEQKDNTLFLGNIQTLHKNVYNIFSLYDTDDIFNIEESETSRSIYPYKVNDDYYNGLVAVGQITSTLQGLVPYTGFRKGNYYRFGVQFQHKTGSWSEPIYLESDYQVQTRVTEVQGTSTTRYHIDWPIIQCSITNAENINESKLLEELYDAGYRRARGVVVLPQGGDRAIVTQGVGCPTMCRTDFSSETHNKSPLGNQSSWFFRPYHWGNYSNVDINYHTDTIVVAPNSVEKNPVTENFMNLSPLITYWEAPPGDSSTGRENFHRTEIQLNFDDSDIPCIDNKVFSLHTPDVEFSNTFSSYILNTTDCYKVGNVKFNKTYSDIEIQTSSPTVSSNGKGIIKKSFIENYDRGIVSGLFYDDYIVDDYSDGSKIEALNTEKCSVKWEVYAWNQDGSLNNDINRPNGMGTKTAELKKKIISNYRLTTSSFNANEVPVSIEGIDIFNSSDLIITKIGDTLYQGNIDTAYYSSKGLSKYFAFGEEKGIHSETEDEITKVSETEDVETYFTSPVVWRMAFKNKHSRSAGTEKYIKDTDNAYKWIADLHEPAIGLFYSDLLKATSIVKIRYKSSPHIALSFNSGFTPDTITGNINPTLPILQIENSINTDTIFGGKSQDALMANTWIPCGEPVAIDPEAEALTVECIYGDTYFQRWDCLKTYPFNRDDTNQIVEIGSFMLESYVNCDGRYDRNRGQLSNINMSPLNFNLFNPVYSQVDNFFNYKILDEQSHKDKKFPNNITWTKTKQNGADVDLWTNVTLASILELDGDKGDITKILKFNDQLLAFQEKGVSQILYNENTQITTTAGVPIEIANSNKVQGKRYLSGTIGCSNKWSICQTPSGVYFIDDNEKSIYMFNGQFNNVTTKYGFNSWIKQTMEDAGSWNPQTFNNFRSFYDSINQEVLFVTKDIALAFSEKLDCFTSFYNYENSSFFETIDGVQIWVHPNSLWKHRGGNYCNFFGTNQPYSMTLIANQEPTVDKIFTNLEFRACVEGEGTVISNKFGFYVPFSNVEVWNEYQHGHSELWQYSGHTSSIHGGTSSHIDRMFRIWRIDIPRDNCEVNSSISTAMGEMTETELGITRMAKHPNNRIRNPWSYIQLSYYNEDEDTVKKAEIHDIMATYFS